MACAVGWVMLAPVVAVCTAPSARLSRMLSRATVSDVKAVDADTDVAPHFEEVIAPTSNGSGGSILIAVDRHESDGPANDILGGTLYKRRANSGGLAGSPVQSGTSSYLANTGGHQQQSPNRSDPELRVVREPLQRLLLQLGSIARGVALDAMQRPAVHFAVFMLGLLVSLMLILLTFGACICNQPMELDSWAMRYSKSKICPPGEVCFQYSLLGGNCSELIVVAHYVAPDGERHPVRFTVEVCPEEGCAAANTTARRIAYGWITPHDDIEEDRRFLGSAVVSKLEGSKVYRLRSVFAMNDGTNAVGATPLVTRTVPCASPSGTNVTFIGGGDFRVGGAGAEIARRAMRQYPDAAFFYIGGDLAYANNIRTCYRRWDKFFRDLLPAITRPQDGATIPICSAPGNHEAGGYLVARTRAQRSEYYEFYHRYFPHGYSSVVDPRLADVDGTSPSSPGLPLQPQGPGSATTEYPLDPTTTFHAHAISSQLGIVVLDSDTMHSVDSQLPFLRATLNTLPTYRHHDDGVSVDPALPRRRLVVLYHNPAYPSEREFDDPISVSVREKFVPIIEQHAADVAFVLEHHDHTYKRTVALRAGLIVNNTAIEAARGRDTNDRGLVFIGDGALGVGEDRSPDTSRKYLHVARSMNYFLGVVIFSNGTTVCSAHGDNGEVVDRYERWGL